MIVFYIFYSFCNIYFCVLGSSIVVGLLIPTFLIVLGGLGCCCAKRYHLLPCQRNLYGNVLVTRDEDDDDDPPIV